MMAILRVEEMKKKKKLELGCYGILRKDLIANIDTFNVLYYFLSLKSDDQYLPYNLKQNISNG